MLPEPYPWSLACGCQHQDDEQCPECTGDRSTGVCMTPELAYELAGLAGLRPRVERAVGSLYVAAVAFLLSQDGA